MKITALTPTADRPIAFALLERMMARQTAQPDQWIVADGGETPAACTMGQIHLHDPRPPGAANFAHNLLNGLAAATGDVIIFAEDDDWLRADHLKRMAAAAESHPLIGAETTQHYHNIAHRCWRTFNNVGASMCQTAIRRELVPAFVAMIRTCLARNTYGIDTNFWRATPREQWGIVGAQTVIGIKGLPGRAGLGIGHRPGLGWTADPHLQKLREWIGDDVETYAGFRLSAAA